MDKPNPFLCTQRELRIKRRKYYDFLVLKELTEEQILTFLKTFDFFGENPKKYNGANAVPDLIDVVGIEVPGKMHDYDYVELNVAANLPRKWKSDIMYGKIAKRFGKSGYTAWSRPTGIILAGIWFVPKALIVRGKMTKEQKVEFDKRYEILKDINKNND